MKLKKKINDGLVWFFQQKLKILRMKTYANMKNNSRRFFF